MSVLQRDPTDRVQILDEDGTVVDGATVPDLSDDELVEMSGISNSAVPSTAGGERNRDAVGVAVGRRGRLAGRRRVHLRDGDGDDPLRRLIHRRVVREIPDGRPRNWMGSESGNRRRKTCRRSAGGPHRFADSPRDRRGVGNEAPRRRHARPSSTSVTARPPRATSTRG